MARTIFTILFIILLQSLTYGYTRMFYMDQELKSASLIKEIIVLGYTSRIDTLPYQEPIGIEKVIDKMTYCFVDNPDSILTYSPPYTGYVNSTPYYHIATKDTSFRPLVPEGYWPAINDTVLIVFNFENHVTLFAELLDSNETCYKFWSPYHTSSWNTIFFINSPFKPNKPTDTKSFGFKIWNHLQNKAKSIGYEFASQYHCLIVKKEFWEYLEEIKKE